MAHFALLWKARTIEKYRQNYENEKVNSIIISNSDIPETTLFQRWRHYRHDMRKRLSRTFSKWYPEGTTVSNFFVSLQTDMGFASILLRSLYGFVGGLLLTYLGFMFFVFQLSLSLMHATVLSSIMGMILTLGLTFSNRIRCLIFLLVPQLFSRVGRYTLTCYALILILTGPATNTLKNSEVLSESMACSQEQIKLNVRQINESMKKPLNSIKASLKITIDGMQIVVGKLKIALIRINRLILSIASVIQSGYYWLGLVVNECNEALGTPYEKCLNALKENFQRCEENLDLNHVKRKGAKNVDKDYVKNLLEIIAMKEFTTLKYKEKVDIKDVKAAELEVRCSQKSKDKINRRDKKISDDKNYKPWFQNTLNVAKIACASLKSYGKFCDAADFAKETILATIKRQLKTFTQHISLLLHVRVNIRHTYTFIGNSSSTNQIAAGIVTEIRNRADPIITWLSWSSCVTSLFLLLIIFRAKHYQHMFETRSRFDNRYITKEFRELDLKRLRERRETVLPLNRRERVKYVTTTSFRLVSSEKVHLNRSALFMIITTLKLLIHMVADYSLYWVLMTIRHHGKLQTPMQPGLADTGAFITGTGFVASLLQSFIDTLNIQLIIPPPDVSCLPNPHPPDFKRYCQIGFLIFLLWFFALFEPYGLRLRHLIMGHYRPERAKARAVWLYNHILRTRASFMKFARRRLHREHKYSSESKLTFGRTLQSLIPCCWLKLLLGIKPEEPHCLLCYITEDASDLNKELIKCEVYYCPGIYCTRCFSDIGQLCTVCLSPSDYGDLSDVSLEKGSSEEDNYDDDSNDDDDDDDDDSDKSYDLGSQNRFNKRNTSNGADAISDEYESSPKGSKISKRNRILSHENNKNRSFENISLKQRCTQGNSAKILAKHRIIKVYTDVLERQPVKIYFVVFECFPPEHVSKKGYRGSIYLFENIAMLKDQNNNNVLAPRKRYSVQYSVYKITKNPFEIIKTDTGTQFSKFLRKKKLIRRKKKEAKMNPLYFKYFMACSQTNLNKLTEKTTQVKDNIDQANVSNNLKSSRNETIDNSPEFKGMKNKNQNRGEHNSRKDTYKLSNKRSKNINKFHTTFAKYWKNVKLTVLPDWGITNTKRDLPLIKEKTHTRKKKHKNMKTHIKSSKNFKLKKIENNRNSRIFTYFDEQDWVNNCIDTTEKLNINKECSLKDPCTQKHDNVVVNNIIIPRLNLDESSESLTTLTKYSPFAIFDISHERVDFAKSALNRFFKSIRGKSDEILESNYIKYNFGETDLNFDEDKGSYLVKNNKCISHFDLYNCKSPSKYNNLQANNLGGHRLKRIFSESVSVSKFSKSFTRIKSACSSLLVRNVGNQQKKTQNKNQNCEIVASMKNQKHAPNKYEKQIQFNTANPIQSLDNIKQRRILNVKEINAENVKKRFIINKNTKETITVKMNQKQTEFDDEKQQPRPTIKEMLEDDKGHIKTKDKPINAREQEQFKEIKNEKEIQTMSTSTQMNDKGVTVVPSTNSCGCYCKVRTQDCAVQASTSFKRPKTQHNNVEVSTSHPLCTCAAQYHPSNKNVCTCFAGQSNSDSTRDSFSSISSEELKTDSTTVCSFSNKHYHSNRFGRFKVKVTTKTNQSTLTDKTHSCNVSTSTYDDWWSPIVDRKYNPRKEDNFLERKKRDYNLMRERKIFKNRGMCTRDKFVTFRSKTQVIPNPEFDYTDVLSPSRYLLESQKYYNELFYKLPFVYPIANIQKHQILDRERSQISSRHHSRRGHNSKRLDETYTSRKQRNPRKRGLEFGRYVAKK